MVDIAEANKLVEDNLALVYFVLKDKLHISVNHPDYDEMVSIGNEALVKASRSYNKDKYTFSTYAITCIYNEICFQYCRKKTAEKRLKELPDVSLQQLVNANSDDRTTYEQLIPDPDSEIVENYALHDFYTYCLSLPLPHKDMFIDWLNGTRIVDLSREYKVSRQRIHQCLNKTKEALIQMVNPVTIQ